MREILSQTSRRGGNFLYLISGYEARHSQESKRERDLLTSILTNFEIKTIPARILENRIAFASTEIFQKKALYFLVFSLNDKIF